VSKYTRYVPDNPYETVTLLYGTYRRLADAAQELHEIKAKPKDLDEPSRVFESLLQDWRRMKQGLIGEFSSDMDAENMEADRQMDEWRKRYREASPDA
jgi:hypothetical protein